MNATACKLPTVRAWRRVPLEAVRRRVADVEWLTSRQVAERLGVHLATVHRIPREELPYKETPGGSSRRGWRQYRADDVEACRARRSGEARRATTDEQLQELRDQLSGVVDRVALLERALVAERVERAGLAERLERQLRDET